MAYETSPIITPLTVTFDGVKVGYAQGVNEAKGYAQKVDGIFADLGRSMVKSILAGLAAIGVTMSMKSAIAGVKELTLSSIGLAAQAEQTRISFTTMLGSAEAAKRLQAEITAFAAATPFDTTGLNESAKSLLAFGTAQEQVIPTLRVLGDLAAGLNIPLRDLADIYGKARVSGILQSEDINQLTGRGIPVIQEFAKQLGVTEGEVKKLAGEGKITFGNLQQALVDLTSEGGKFAGLMSAQSESLAGKWSTLGDAIEQAKVRIGEAISENLDLRGAVEGVTMAVETLAETGMPLLDRLFGRFAEGGSTAQRTGGLILDAVEWVSLGVARATDVLGVFEAGWHVLRAGVLAAGAGILSAIDLIGDSVVRVLNLLPGVDIEWTYRFHDMAKSVWADAKAAFDEAGVALDDAIEMKATRSVEDFFEGVRAKAEAAATATAGVGDAIAALEIDRSAAAQAAEAQRRKEAEKEAEKLARRAKDLLEDAMSPSEQLKAQIAEIEDLFARGFIDEAGRGKLLSKLREDISSTADKAAIDTTPRLISFIRSGSQEDFRLRAEIAANKDANRIPQDQLAEARRQTELLDIIARSFTTPRIAADFPTA